MIIGGLQKFTLLDFPGKLSAIIFTYGCNFKCQFCYNPMLVSPGLGKTNQEGLPQISEDGLFAFLEERVGKLDGVVITGGEPTMHKDLPVFIRKIKELGFAVKLDTNGTDPKMLKALLSAGLVDRLAMDVKGPERLYNEIVQVKADLKKIKESITLIIASGIPYEFRTTIVPSLLAVEDIAEMGRMIKGADAWYLQQFNPDADLVNMELKQITPYPRAALKKMQAIGARYVKRCKIR